MLLYRPCAATKYTTCNLAALLLMLSVLRVLHDVTALSSFLDQRTSTALMLCCSECWGLTDRNPAQIQHPARANTRLDGAHLLLFLWLVSGSQRDAGLTHSDFALSETHCALKPAAAAKLPCPEHLEQL